jgi:membrane protease YdiL (CAAX protease family)
MESDKKLSHLLYFALMALIPFFLWVVSSKIANSLTFIIIGILFIASQHISTLNFLKGTLEIVFLFLLLGSLINRLGLGNYFPLDRVICIFCLYFFLFRIKKTGANELNLKVGKIYDNFFLCVIFALISVVCLAVWFVSQKNNPYAEYIPEAPTILLILMGIGFAAINSIYEEGVFRSIFFSYFSKEVGFAFALILQALWFSFLHYRTGFPSGAIGILLTFIFGIMMGYLVNRTKGILIPVIIHFIADISIFVLVLSRINGFI